MAVSQCSICLDDMADDDGSCFRLTECGHQFHSACVITWFRTNHECPLCRGTPAIKMTRMDVQQRCDMLLESPPDEKALRLAAKIKRHETRWKKAQRKLGEYDRSSALASTLQEAKRAYWALIDANAKAQAKADDRVQRAARALSTHRAPLLDAVRRHEKAMRVTKRELGLHGLGSAPPQVVTSNTA